MMDTVQLQEKEEQMHGEHCYAGGNEEVGTRSGCVGKFSGEF
jgi:hypothetical protein